MKFVLEHSRADFEGIISNDSSEIEFQKKNISKSRQLIETFNESIRQNRGQNYYDYYKMINNQNKTILWCENRICYLERNIKAAMEILRQQTFPLRIEFNIMTNGYTEQIV